MNVLENTINHNILTVKIKIEAHEFAFALHKAYMENKDKLIFPGREEDLLSRQELEQMFGAAVLYDEALYICIQKLYLELVHEYDIKPVNQPEIANVSRQGDGSVTCTIKVATRPKIYPEQYKGIIVKVPASDNEAFTEAVISEAASRIDVVMPDEVVLQKLNAMLAEKKLQISQDPIYNLLADMVEILKKAYHATGVDRPIAQVRSEAMDIMLQSISKDQKKPSREHLYFLLQETVKEYRELPNQFHEKLDKILEERKQRTLAMTPDERAGEAFSAYLGSLDITEEGWLNENRKKAVIYGKFDMLLDGVTEAEAITVTQEELDEAITCIGRQCSIDPEHVKASIDSELLEWQLKRDKARKLILDSAAIRD